MPSAWFEPAIPDVMRRQTCVFDRMATSVGGGMWRRKTKLLWEGLGPSATLSTTNPTLFYYRCRLIAGYFSHPARNFHIYSVLKVHQLVDCLPSDVIDRWHAMSLRPADLTTRSTPSPTQMVRLSSSGRPSQCNRRPPPHPTPPDVPDCCMISNPNFRNDFRRSESRDPLVHGAWSGFVPSVVY